MFFKTTVHCVIVKTTRIPRSSYPSRTLPTCRVLFIIIIIHCVPADAIIIVTIKTGPKWFRFRFSRTFYAIFVRDSVSVPVGVLYLHILYIYIYMTYCGPLPYLKLPIYVSAVVVKNKTIPRDRITMLYCRTSGAGMYYIAEFAVIKTRSWRLSCYILYVYTERERRSYIFSVVISVENRL